MDAISATKSSSTSGIPHWLRGGSSLYLVSAACILVGVDQLIVPVYENPDAAWEKFRCLAALNFYEIMLLAVALVIVLWKHVVDDAAALAGLIAAFLVASAVALDTIAPDFSGPALALGAAGLILALGKLYALDAYVTGGMRGIRLLGVAVLLLWNFLMPGIMGLVNAHHLGETFRQAWLAGGLVILAGGAVLVVQAVPRRVGGFRELDDGKPFLETSAMHWILVAIVLVGSLAHQYAMNWAFNVNTALGDMLPAFCLIALLIHELRRAYANVSRLNGLVLCLPLVAIWIALARHAYTVTLGWLDLGTLSYPSVVALGMGIVVAVLAWPRRNGGLHAIASLYLLTGLGHLGWKVYELIAIKFGWMMVALSFLTHALGALATVVKSRAMEASEAIEPVGDRWAAMRLVSLPTASARCSRAGGREVFSPQIRSSTRLPSSEEDWRVLVGSHCSDTAPWPKNMLMDCFGSGLASMTNMTS
jgi:hypothetical protein